MSGKRRRYTRSSGSRLPGCRRRLKTDPVSTPNAHIAHLVDGRRRTRRGLAGLCATDAGSILGEAVHPVRKPPALQFAVHQRAWRTDKKAAERA
ncbi:MAG: hypothetical protein QOJ56_5990 [Mycobacterium sp.]|jgi:hypothetical protein|nr:hypothetical protein [Mycobacterium sp.]